MKIIYWGPSYKKGSEITPRHAWEVIEHEMRVNHKHVYTNYEDLCEFATIKEVADFLLHTPNSVTEISIDDRNTDAVQVFDTSTNDKRALFHKVIDADTRFNKGVEPIIQYIGDKYQRFTRLTADEVLRILTTEGNQKTKLFSCDNIPTDLEGVEAVLRNVSGRVVKVKIYDQNNPTHVDIITDSVSLAYNKELSLSETLTKSTKQSFTLRRISCI